MEGGTHYFGKAAPATYHEHNNKKLSTYSIINILYKKYNTQKSRFDQ